MSREAVFIVDIEWRIIQASSASAKLFGRSNKSLLHSSVFSLLPERLRDVQRQIWSTATDDSIRLDALGINRGEEFPLKVEVAKVNGHEGFTCVIMQDLRTANRQSQKMEALGLLAGGVAHDFNNALTAIIGFTGGVRDELDASSPLRADLDEVLGAAQSASELTNQLLSFSRRRAPQSAPIELNRSVLEMERLLRKTLPTSIEFEVVPCHCDVHTRFERSELHQILINLASNASDAMKAGGRLRISVNTEEVRGRDGLEDGEYAVIDLADSGVGIPKEILGSIFDPFFSTKGEDGTGLGLSTCFGLARQARGTLLVASTEGRGTTFSLYLPTSASAPPRALTSTQGIALRRKYGAALVVEDQPAVRKYLVRTLRKVGLTVIDVGSAEEALVAYDALDVPPELLVTDMMLAGQSGSDLARALVNRNPGLKVLLISGNTEPALTTLELENTEFLGKPFTVAQMRRAVEQLLNPPNHLDGHLLVVAPTAEQQRDFAALFTDINLKQELLGSVNDALKRFDEMKSTLSLVCLGADLPENGAAAILADLRQSRRHATTPVIVMDSVSSPWLAPLDSSTVLLSEIPTTLEMFEALYGLGLQFASR